MRASPTTSRCGNEGFTLIEVLMATLILTVGLLGLLQSIQVAFQHKVGNLMREEAIQIAEEEMNSWKRLSFDEVTANNITKPIAPQRTVAGGMRNFVMTRQHEERTGVDVKKLTVGIAWSFKNITSRHEIYSIKVK